MRRYFVIFSILIIIIAVVCYFIANDYRPDSSVSVTSEQTNHTLGNYVEDKNDSTQKNNPKNTKATFDLSKQVTASGSSGRYNEPLTPTSPTNLVATIVSSSQINLTWQDNSDNEDGFKIERLTQIEGNHEIGWWKETNYIQIDMVGPNITSYSDANLLHGSYYKYRVKAYNQVGDSEYFEPENVPPSFLSQQLPKNSQISPELEKYWKHFYQSYSNEAFIYTLPLAPKGLTATAVSHKEIALTWTNLSDYYGITILKERSTDGINFIDWGETGGNSSEDTGYRVKPDTTYYYRVRASITGGYSQYSNVISATTLPLTIAYAISQVEALYRTSQIIDNVFYSFLIINLNEAQNLLDNKDTAATLTKLKEIEDKIWAAIKGRGIGKESGIRFRSYIGDLSSSIDRSDDEK